MHWLAQIGNCAKYTRARAPRCVRNCTVRRHPVRSAVRKRRWPERVICCNSFPEVPRPTPAADLTKVTGRSSTPFPFQPRPPSNGAHRKVRPMTASASEPIHLGTYPAAWNRVPAQEDGLHKDVAVVNRTAVVTQPGRMRAVGRDEHVDVSSSMWSWTTLLDGVVLLGVVWSLPVAVLVVGSSVALAVTFLLWLVRLALSAF